MGFTHLFFREANIIRLAKVEDIPRLQELLEQILIVHHQARPDVFKAKGSKFTDKELEAVIGDANKSVFVYEDETGTILGHLFLMIKEVSENDSPQKPVKTLFIDDLCVDKDARGQKLGERFYHFALDYAKEKGCYNVTLHVWNDNAGALRFYERLGMKPRYTEMETILK
ncbi:N-acetyltransferase [Streptococcus thermophilus]|nr:N-acetyltransferase [Streptococcus thermophilus]CAD0150147.1 N-acetyltransferase [Streptococcus thermophilus]